MTHNFKAGDPIKRVREPMDWAPLGFETTVTKVMSDSDIWYDTKTQGEFWGSASNWELVQPVGPVLTEMVPKTRIVPGTYDGVYVEATKGGRVYIQVGDRFGCQPFSADELDAAAAVLSALAKGLRDAN